jgi:hypothetical protein
LREERNTMERSSVLEDLLAKLKRRFNKDPEPPEDPYAYVGAPKKPRPPYRKDAAAAPLE